MIFTAWNKHLVCETRSSSSEDTRVRTATFWPRHIPEPRLVSQVYENIFALLEVSLL